MADQVRHDERNENVNKGMGMPVDTLAPKGAAV